MPSDVRGLIIAAQQYPAAQGLSSDLQGVLSAAQSFADWLMHAKKVDPADVWLCADDSLAIAGVNKFGNRRADVRKALTSLSTAGINITRQLYVFLSGHGFAFQTTALSDPADMFVCSDYVDLATGGDACIGIPELQQSLGYWLGGIDHFYFADCCRNIIDQTRINPVTLGLSLPGAQSGRPFIYTLYSTSSGSQAYTTSGFSPRLIEALNGKGRAKGWTPDNLSMQVLFDLVCRYVKDKVGNQKVDSKPGGGDGVIFTLSTIPSNECKITVKGADAADVFHVQLLLRGQPFGGSISIHGATGKIAAQPDVYGIAVQHTGLPVIQDTPPPGTPLDLYDPCEASFRLQPTGPTPAPVPVAPSTLTVSAPPHTTIEVTNLNTSQQLASVGGVFNNEVDPGHYKLSVLEDGVAIREKLVTLEPGSSESQDMLMIPDSPVHSSIASAIGSKLENGFVDFSETLGAMANDDMGLWLSILGASKIIDSPQAWSKLRRITTASFDDIQPGESVLFLLVAFEQENVPVIAGAHEGTNISWFEGEAVSKVNGLQQIKVPIEEAGPGLISLALGRRPVATMPIHTVPNRVTLIVVCQERSEQSENRAAGELRHLRIYQYILPLSRLAPFEDSQLSMLTAAHQDLRSIRAMFTIQRRFCGGKNVAIPGHGEMLNLWQDAMYGKWLDPMMSVIMCYELIRRGQAGKSAADIRIVAGNLQRYFGLPDAAAILKLAGLDGNATPATAPLFVDGVMPYTSQKLLPFPASKLDFRGPWTTWRNVVALTDTEVSNDMAVSRMKLRKRSAQKKKTGFASA